MRQSHIRAPRFIATMALLAAVAAQRESLAATILSEGHVDVGVHYGAGEWEFEVHDGENDVEYDPADVILLAKKESIVARPAGANYDFLGVPAGADIWLLPQGQNPSLLFLGIANEENVSSDFSTWNPGDPRIPAGSFRWLEWELVSASGPGEFALYSEGSGSVTNWMSTFSNPNPNAFYQLIGSHSHVNWAFTAAGDYAVTFRVTARLADGSFSTSDDATFHFRAEPLQSAVPEPSSLALAGIGMGVLGFVKYRRRGARSAHVC